MSYCSLQCWWWSNVFRRPNSRCKINRQDLKAYGLSKTSYQPIKLVKLVGIGHSVSWWHVSATCHSVAFCRSQFQFSVSVPSIQQNKILFIRYHTSKSYGNKTGIISNTNHDDRRLTSKRDTERPAGCGGFTARCATAYRLAVNYLCFSRRRSLAVGSPASHGQPHYSKRRAQLAKTARHRYRAVRSNTAASVWTFLDTSHYHWRVHDQLTRVANSSQFSASTKTHLQVAVDWDCGG